MKNKQITFTKTALVTAALLSTSAFAGIQMENDHCNVDLNYDLTISPQHVRIIEKDETLIDIYNDQQLFIKGHQIDLDNNQQALVTQYSTSLRNTIPEVGAIAIEAVNVAFEGIEVALGGHVDLTDSRGSFDELEQKISEKFNDKDGYYSFKQGEFTFDTDDKELDILVEDAVEDMMPKLIGGLLSNIGNAVANGQGLASLENLGENIEQEVEKRAEKIEERADKFCQSLVAINEMEKDLVSSDKQFADFDLINVERMSKDNASE